MSFFSKFNFKNLGHYAAVVARDIVKFGGAVQKAEPLIEGITAQIYPPAVVLERAGNSALGYLIDAADKVVPASGGTTTLTLELATDEINDFKALAGFFKGHAVANGVVLPK